MKCIFCGRFMRKLWKVYAGKIAGEKDSYWCSNLDCLMTHQILHQAGGGISASW